MNQSTMTELARVTPSSQSGPRLKNGWVFSPRTDLVLFGIPFLLGWLLLLINAVFDLKSVYAFNRSTFVATFALANFLDVGHVLSTVLTTYFKPETRAKHRSLLLVGPLIILGINVTIYEVLGITWVIYFFAYYNFYHVVRQQYGWISISAKKAGEGSRVDRWLDKLVIYGVMVLPFVWIHLSLSPNSRRITIPTNPALAKVTVAVLLALIAVYGARQAHKWYRGEPLNLAKLFIVASTALTWGGALFTRSPFTALIGTIVHGTPYVGIIYITDKHEGALRSKLEHHLRALAPAAFGLLVLLAGFSWVRILRYFDGAAGGRFVDWVVVIGMIVPISHYVIDGVIWRRRTFNPARDLLPRSSS